MLRSFSRGIVELTTRSNRLGILFCKLLFILSTMKIGRVMRISAITIGMSALVTSFFLVMAQLIAVLPSPTFPYARLDSPPRIEPYVVRLPADFNPAEAHPIILVFHGSGVSARDSLYKQPQSALVERLLKAGYIVAASESHTQNWGNTASVIDNELFYTYLTNSYRISKIGGLGQSMGGLTSTIVAERQNIPLKAMVQIYPVVNIASVYHDPRFTTFINAAYSDTHWNEPLRQTDTIKNLPFLIYASPNDTWVPKALNTDPLAEKLDNDTVVTTTGDHGDPSNFQPEEVVRFFDRWLK